MSCSAYFWGGLIKLKNKGGGELFQISQKERLFHFFHEPSYNLAMWSPFASLFCTLPKKGLFSSWVNWNESLLIYFENCRGVPCFHRQSRNRLMNTFIIVTITSIRDSLEDKSMLLVPFKKAFLSLYLDTPYK